MEQLTGILVPITFFALIGIVVFFTLKYNYQIKKALIDKGGEIDLTKRKFPFLEIGLTLLGIGLGLAVSVIPKSSNLPEVSQNLLIGACILIFGGLGLVSAFIIRRRIEKQ
ncbi:MAG: hypothetical protein NT144_00380 [Bacteroidia bacterium]|nr:hypothetical protein [Bacteroidia bacterium]